MEQVDDDLEMEILSKMDKERDWNPVVGSFVCFVRLIELCST